MSTPIGSVIVVLAICVGFGLSGGNFMVLFQPNEFIVICGAAFGSLFISAPGKIRSEVFKALKHSLTIKLPTKEEFLDLLKLQYEVYSFVRRNGAVALESHLAEIEKSDIFKKYPTFLARHHAVEFFRDALNQMVNGTGPEEMDMLLEAELETHHQEGHIPVSLITKVGDSMPGLGIVAAVLGIIITMGHLDGGPEEIGHHVAAALVGTFLGILVSYGFLQPIATSIELSDMAESKYFQCIREGLLATLRGSAPMFAVEFARKALFSAERPSAAELEAACASLKGGT
ncbi:MAG: flagellar motor stator protein MotA [Myxococcota bacterium]